MVFVVATTTRRRKFCIILIVCCISFFTFGWYTSRDLQGMNDLDVTRLIESLSIQPELPDADDALTIKSVEQTESANKQELYASSTVFTELSKIEHTLTDSKESTEDDDADFLNKFNSLVKPISHEKPPLDIDLVSGPTPLNIVPTDPSKKDDDDDDEFLKKFYDSMNPISRQKAPFDVDLVSGPTPLNMAPTESSVHQKSSSPTPSVDVESSGSSKISDATEQSLAFTPAMKTTKNPSLIIDTYGCKIPKLDPWDPTVIELIATDGPIICSGPPLFMNPEPHGSISLNETILEEHYNHTKESLLCTYQPIKRKHEDEGGTRENNYELLEARKMIFGVPLNEDYVVVQCVLEPEKTFEQYFALVRIKPEIEEDRTKKELPDPQLNVILLGVDSVSKLNFLRHFKRTKAFLKDKMYAYEMKGYTKVGDNTFPNLMTMLTGHFIEYYWNETVKDTYCFDDIDHIWRDYARRGYRTFYAEDSPYTGTFQYLKRGFYDPPVDYYFRPIALAVENSKIREISDSHCLHSQLETDILYDYLRNFVSVMDKKPYIAFVMASTITHDYFNNAAYADDPTARIVEDLWNQGALENSFLVLFSDHGLRFGKIRETYIGKFEERMPFMYIHFPNWFMKKYPEYEKNMQSNQERLMTLFDIHATMIHLLDLKRQWPLNDVDKENITRGTSLLTELPDSRTCEEANILEHWCPCQTYNPVAFNDTKVLNTSQKFVDHINELLSGHQDICAKLEVDQIIDARIGQASELVQKFQRHENDVINKTLILGEPIATLADYLITLRTKPGGAVLEGTIRVDLDSDTYTVKGISRINMYGNSSACIDSQYLKIFCYCNSNLT